jgi:hypothetical protein
MAMPKVELLKPEDVQPSPRQFPAGRQAHHAKAEHDRIKVCLAGIR